MVWFANMGSYQTACGRVAALAIAACSGLAAASDTFVGPQSGVPSPRVLQLRTGDVDTRSLPNVLETGGSIDPDNHYVLQLDGPLSPQRSEALTGAGVVVGEHLPQNAFIVQLDNAAVANLESLPFVVWLGDFESGWKVAPDLGLRPFQSAERSAIYDAGQVRVTITLFPATPTTGVVAELNRAGAAIASTDQAGDQWLIDATLDYDSAVGLADRSDVQFVEDSGEAVFRNDSNRWILQSNVNPQTPVWDNGIHGESQIGGLIDGAVRESHCMFDDAVPPGPTHRKIIGYRGTTGSDSHGTHTAGTFVGDNTPFNAYTTNDGMAFAAKLSFKNLSSITGSNLYSSLQEAHNDGARVHSNSWGDDSTRSYTSWCRQIDQFSWDFEDNVVAFAISNGSQSTTPENATNCLAVAASQDTPNQASHCSGGTGPTVDGRRKPEVYAPGCNTTSANASTTCGVTGMSGTSMACPAASGAGLLVRQYFTAGYYPSGTASAVDGFVPTGGLVRAVLMNSAVDMTGISGYPSNLEGWGRLLLDKALYFAGDASKLIVKDVRKADGLSTGQSAVYTVNVLSDTQALRITMTFTQPPAAVNAANPAINNLDLEVVEPGGDTYRGNTFTSGQSSSGGTADIRNNTEMVIRTAPTPGVYTVRVVGTAVNTGPSPYALAITGDVSEECPEGDIDGNCHVDLSDLSLLLAAFGSCTGDPAFNAAADFDASGCVDLNDLSLLLSNFGA